MTLEWMKTFRREQYKKPATNEHGLHDTALRIWRFIDRYERGNGYPPSYRKIMDACNISSTSVVRHHINTLEKRGYIERVVPERISLRLLKRPDDKAVRQ